MNKSEQFKELMSKMASLKDEKREAIKIQSYEKAAAIRDKERKLINEVDELVELRGFYQSLVSLEKVNHHVSLIKESLHELSRLDVFELGGIKMHSIFNGEFDEFKDKIYEAHINVHEDLTNFRKNALGDIIDNEFDEGLGFKKDKS